MGGGVSTDKATGGVGEGAPPLPGRGVLRTLGLKKKPKKIPHGESWLEVRVALNFGSFCTGEWMCRRTCL
eukprot:2025800-Rhodomonas_salina.1